MKLYFFRILFFVFLKIITKFAKKKLTMTNGKLSENEIKDLLINFNLDESINDLKKYYSTPTMWEIIKQSRRETSHSQFLAWFLGNKDFNANPNTGPIKKLVVLLLKWSNRQNKSFFDKQLAESIYSQDLYINSYDVEAEFPVTVGPINGSDPAYGDGDIDIFITADIKINNQERKLHIVIENKIGSPETTKCFDKNGKQLKTPNKKITETTLYQTEAYHQYCIDQFKDDINLFVYLKPTDCSLDDIHEAECMDKKYIQINYQELLDNIIQPVYEQKEISEESAYRLKDYIKTLGKPSENEENNKNKNKKITIMAMEQKERELLIKFFENNEDLIRAAINALGNEDLSKSMSEVPKGHPRRHYTINGEGNYSMYDVLEKFIKYKLKSILSVQNINTEILSYVGGNKVYVSDDPRIKVYREDDKDKVRFGTLEVDKKNIRYTKEWGDGDDKQNFAKFRKKVSAKYKDFVINLL